MSAPRWGRRRGSIVICVLAVAAVTATVVYVLGLRRVSLPAPGSEAYELTTKRFYRGLAELEVGLLDAAIENFTNAITTAPNEPASWANLGLTHLRLGALDDAAPAIERAAMLAPESAAVAFLQGRFETLRGRRNEGIVHLRRAVELDPDDLRARTALIQEIESAGGPDADGEAQRLLEGMLERQPNNAAVLVERARLAAKRGDRDLLRESVSRLDRFAAEWPADVLVQYAAVQAAAAGVDTTAAARPIAFLRNVLARVPEFRDSRRRVTPSTELVADPFARFLRLPLPPVTPAPADAALSFVGEAAASAPEARWQSILSVPLDDDQPPALFVADAATIVRVGAPTSTLPFPGGSASAPPVQGLAAVDWNHDFRPDLVAAGSGGVRLFLQALDGTFVDGTVRASGLASVSALDATGAWVADIEMDGDLDLVIGERDREPVVLQNNGDGQWQAIRRFGGVRGLLAFGWGDIDDDGDPDAALLDGSGAVHLFVNLQAGQFQIMPTPRGQTAVIGLTLGDLNADGRLDVVTLDATGVIRRMSKAGDGWMHDERARWTSLPPATSARLFIADLDNNGALDVIASAGAETAIWLATDDLTLTRLESTVHAAVWSVADLDGDGQLDLAGLVNGAAARLTGRQTRGYHFQVVRPRAQTAAGDQRINTFGIGGVVEVRSGLLVQKQVITGPVVHVGLGTRTRVDVTRVVWPNGVAQAEFDPAIDAPIVAVQRLKGSCPWIFADDGTGLRFVTDFLWRSPLGLRLNAQDTAGVTQTEDWVKIRGDQLAARDGAYDIRISAELWETHFVDHVSLMVVDRPPDVEVFVDERFVPGTRPTLMVQATGRPRPIAHARDHAGRNVTELVARRDGRYLATFERGQYQGVAEDHFVEIEIEAPIPRGRAAWLVAHGWVYPTDSSINVAIGQGRLVRPSSLSLEAQNASGHWVVVASDLGFPAGKNKTVLLDLGLLARAGVPGARRLRLRTNLEIYWDSIAYAEGVTAAPVQTVRVQPSEATLRYRGFSQTSFAHREQPETPSYERIANTVPRWRDLVGYYTRFGDVRELLSSVEDRYVIMNAGDELRLSFPAPPPPAPGWLRDFVLIGDGWVKDGDYNTSFSKTVVPLPAHGVSAYLSASNTPALEQDPVYLRHRADWQTFHTRFVAPDAFVAGLGK